jgi:phage FluMu protein Com
MITDIAPEVRAVPIHFRCPHCEKLLAIGTAKGGTQIHCPMCTRLLTVPPRTEVKLPTTTVMPPDLAQPAWWMEAPPAVPPQPESPAPPDTWWLAANVPPAPSVPPQLPQPLVFEPAAKTPALDTNSTARFFTPVQVLLILGAIVVALLVVSVLFVLLRG